MLRVAAHIGHKKIGGEGSGCRIVGISVHSSLPCFDAGSFDSCITAVPAREM